LDSVVGKLEVILDEDEERKGRERADVENAITTTIAAEISKQQGKPRARAKFKDVAHSELPKIAEKWRSPVR
jgi:hypothetical protein